MTEELIYITNYYIDLKDRKILKGLTLQVSELAAKPSEDKKRDLWYRHNALEATRPLIFCDPENGWNEIIPKEKLQCRGDLARQWEFHLRREIFCGKYMEDDRVVEPFFNIGYIYTESDWGMHEIKTGGTNGGSYHWDAPLKDYKDLDRLHFPIISVDYEQTENLLHLAEEIFGDLLQVRLKMMWWWTMGLTQTLIYLRGLEQIMYDMYDYPDELHRLMGFLRDGHMAKLDFLEKEGLLSLNNDGTYVGSGGFGYCHMLPQKDFNGKVRTLDMWGFSESQETSEVSPAMFDEFVFTYQLPLLERFGLNCYGCCEALNKRWDIIRNIPHLRRVSVSPWADLENMAEKLGKQYIYSMKPSPSDLAVPAIDEDFIRNKLRSAMKTTKECHVEIIMKDNHTICNNPQNVIRWCQIAREESESL